MSCWQPEPLRSNQGQTPQVSLEEDFWKYRKIVYTNPALASLIRCFHGRLAHVKEINWKPDANYDVDGFLDLLGKEHLKITFDQPMNEYTVKTLRSFRVSIFIVDRRGLSNRSS